MGPLLVLTDRRQARRPLLEVLAAAVRAGTRLIVVRERDLPAAERLALAGQVQSMLDPVGGRALLAGTIPWPPGRHLATTDPWDRGTAGLLGRSCHTRSDVQTAAEAGADYATLSPAFATRSKPGYGPPLDLAVFAAPGPIPVYALGGIDTAGRARSCRRAGASGVAVMGAIMRAADPAAVTTDLLAAVEP
ncbi:MAG: thiamine phosphate synthase [Dactylosporangium sp.]|nr:thiamine phosphate synthase [Dactylosporangium sp.]